jgi:RNA polymerase sigma-70 factor (ECF subfamily)
MLLLLLAALDTEEERRTMTGLYEGHKYRLMSIAMSKTINFAMAEEAVQDTFESAIKHKDTVFSMDNEEFIKWSAVVVKNKCYDLMRRVKRRQNQETPYEKQRSVPSSGETIEVQLIDKVLKEQMKKHVAALDPVNRQIIDMRYELDLTFQEIADELGFTLDKVKSRHKRIKAKLKLQMDDEVNTRENIQTKR